MAGCNLLSKAMRLVQGVLAPWVHPPKGSPGPDQQGWALAFPRAESNSSCLIAELAPQIVPATAVGLAARLESDPWCLDCNSLPFCGRVAYLMAMALCLLQRQMGRSLGASNRAARTANRCVIWVTPVLVDLEPTQGHNQLGNRPG